MKTKSRSPIHKTVRKAKTDRSPENIIEMAPVVMHLSNVLVPLDMSETSLKALRYAIPFAKQFDAKLTLVHVVEMPAYSPELPYPPPLASQRTKEFKKALAKLRDENVPPEIATQLVVCHDFAADAVVATARKTKADLIIVSTHGHTGLKRVFLGSTAETIVRHAPCPVLVVREKEHDFA